LASSLNPEVQNINNSNVFHDEFIKLLKISESLAQKIIDLKNELNCFKEPKDLLQIPELTNIDLREWEEEGKVITIKQNINM